jgi:hypothetical protein
LFIREDQPNTHTTWHQPFTDLERIEKTVHFTLSQAVTGICTAGDIQGLPQVWAAFLWEPSTRHTACRRISNLNRSKFKV